MKFLLALFVSFSTFHAFAQELMQDALADREVTEGHIFDYGSSVLYLKFQKIEITGTDFTDKAVFVASLGCSAEIELKDISTNEDLVIIANAGPCDSFISLNNVSAKNIVIIAEAKGSLQIKYIGNIRAEGHIVEKIGRNKSFRSIHAPFSNMIQKRNASLSERALKRYSIYMYELKAYIFK